MAKKIHGQPLHFERVYPQRRSAQLASCSQIPFSPLPGLKTSAQEEAVTGQCPKETLNLFIVCGQTAGVFGSGWNGSHLLLLILVISHQGHLLADTIWHAVNTMWCEIYGDDTCVDDCTCLECIVTFQKKNQTFSIIQHRHFFFSISSWNEYRIDIQKWHCWSFNWPWLTTMWVVKSNFDWFYWSN